jgi:hypothetical protein
LLCTKQISIPEKINERKCFPFIRIDNWKKLLRLFLPPWKSQGMVKSCFIINRWIYRCDWSKWGKDPSSLLSLGRHQKRSSVCNLIVFSKEFVRQILLLNPPDFLGWVVRLISRFHRPFNWAILIHFVVQFFWLLLASSVLLDNFVFMFITEWVICFLRANWPLQQWFHLDLFTQYQPFLLLMFQFVDDHIDLIFNGRL